MTDRTAPIRIMHFVDNMGRGGLENGLVNLIHRLDPAQFEHVVFSMRRLGFSADLLPDRVRVICLEKKETDLPIQAPSLARSIREVRPDIVHSRNWAAVEAVMAARWERSPAIVHSEHGLDAGTDKEPWRRTCFRRLAFELADRVLCVSHHLGQLHARRTGYRKDRMTIIHNGVDTRRFFSDPAARARMRRELGIAEDDFCIGCVGNLTPVKDHATLLRAIEGIARACPNWRVVLVGDGPERSRLEAFVREHDGWAERVSFLGLRDGVPELLNAFDVYVLCSLTEGISNSLLEAMATGLPVIATAAGGNPEVAVDGDSGLLFPVGDDRRLMDHLIELRTETERRTELKERALRRVREEFSIDSMVRNYEQVYSSLAQRKAAAVTA